MPYLLTLPQGIDSTIRERMLTLAEIVSTQYESLTFGDDIEIEHLPHNSCDGFIAHTNGGYKISLLMDTSTAISMGKFISPDVKEFCERLQKDAESNFISENEERLTEAGYSDELANFWDILEQDDELKEDFYNYETEYISTVYYVEIRVLFFAPDNYWCSKGYNGEVAFDFSVNLDEYGREKHSKPLASVSLDIGGLTTSEINREVFDFFESKA